MYGIDAVLAHQTPNGTKRPITYASRSLSKAEQLEKVALMHFWSEAVLPVSHWTQL